MKKSRRRALVAVLVALGVALGVTGYFVVNTLRSEDVAVELPFDKPESLLFHERLAQHIEWDSEDRYVWKTHEPDLERAFESLVCWQAVFAIVVEKQQDPEARREVDELLAKAPIDWTDEDKAIVEEIVAENADTIERTREAVRLGGPIELFSPDVPRGTNAAQVSFAAKLTCLRVGHHAHRDDQAAAIDDVLLAMETADLLAAEPRLVSHISYLSIYRTTTRAMYGAFPPGTIEPRQLDRLLAHTTQAHHREAFAETLRCEASSVASRFVDGVMSTARPSWQASLVHRSAQRSRNNYVHAIIPLIRVAELPYHEAAPTFPKITESSVGFVEGLRYSRDDYSTGATRVTVDCFAMQARHEAAIDLFRMGLLIEQHCAEHGSHPDSLEMLAPALGGTVPLDPFSGEPYRYVVNDDEFLLYGVGQNQVDDGGVHDQTNDDWVWRGE